jgi:hypothetical protein
MNRLKPISDGEMKKVADCNKFYLDRNMGPVLQATEVGSGPRLPSNSDVWTINSLTGKKELSKKIRNNIEKPKPIPNKKLKKDGTNLYMIM